MLIFLIQISNCAILVSPSPSSLALLVLHCIDAIFLFIIITFMFSSSWWPSLTPSHLDTRVKPNSNEWVSLVRTRVEFFCLLLYIVIYVIIERRGKLLRMPILLWIPTLKNVLVKEWGFTSRKKKYIMLSCGPPCDTHVRPNLLQQVSSKGQE